MLVQNGEGRCDYLIALGEFIPVPSKRMLERMGLYHKVLLRTRMNGSV
jgi:hypothetical protein